MIMNTVSLSNGCLNINSHPVFIFSGELHYFRVKMEEWKDRIKKGKQARLNTISSYIPWRWHAPDPNTLDFGANKVRERNVARFLELIQEEDLYFIARIGPICHGEMTNDGLPGWLLDKYPEIKLRDDAGRTNPYSNLVDYHHPVLHEKIKEWYTALIEELRPFFYTNGGPIVLIQLDNEISMLNWLTSSPNYNSNSTKMFRSFLKKKYKNIETLNSTFKTDYQDFNEVEQPKENYQREKGIFFYEWSEYYREYYARYYGCLYETVRNLNVTLPVLANIPQIYDYDVKGRGNMGIMTTSMFKKFPDYAEDLLFGGAYQYRRVDYENFTDIFAMTEMVRMITPDEHPIICAEMQTGIMFDRPVLYPSDVELNIKTSTGTGLNGINCYMFAGGENRHNMGGMADHHNWQAAVGADGKPAEHYSALRKTGQILDNLSSLLPKTSPLHDLNMGLYLPYYQTEYMSGAEIDQLSAIRDSSYFDGLLRLTRLAGYSYRFVDLMAEPVENFNDTTWIFSLEHMDPNTQKNIIRLSEKGINLLLYPNIPKYDLNGDKCPLLKEYLGIKEISSARGANKVVKPESEFRYYGGGFMNLFTLDKAAGQGADILYTSPGNTPTAFEIQKDNSRVLICGFDLNHRFDFQVDLIEKFAGRHGVTRHVSADNRFVDLLLRRGKEGSLLFAANYTEMDQRTDVKIRGTFRPDNFALRVSGRTGLILPVNYQINEELFLHYTTAEIIDMEKNGEQVALILQNPGHEITLCYTGNYELSRPEPKSMAEKDGYSHYTCVPRDKENMKVVLQKK